MFRNYSDSLFGQCLVVLFHKIKRITGLEDDELKVLLVEKLGWNGKTLNRRCLTRGKVKKETIKAMENAAGTEEKEGVKKKRTTRR